MFYAYVIRSEMTGRLYKGSCEDLAVRIDKHNVGKVRSTRPHRPWRLIYHEEFPTRSEAFHREQYWETVSLFSEHSDQGFVETIRMRPRVAAVNGPGGNRGNRMAE